LPSLEEKIASIHCAIAAQEALRPMLGDAVVDVTVNALQTQLEALREEQRGNGSPKAAQSLQALLAQLQSYIPKQLADKMRLSGQIEGEQRQVTVLFADISGFTSLSERLDPEVVASLVNDCLKELAQAVYQHEGMVDKFVGDCIMAVFGAPVALEDDAERALRAALSMRENLQAINRRWAEKLGAPLDLHIGVNTGMVIAGNVGSDLRMSYTVLGDTVNVAARLRDAAKGGQIFVSQKTWQMTRGLFTFETKPPVQVKGKQDPLPVYELLHARIQPSKTRGLEGFSSPLVGRERERDRLIKRLGELKTGLGQIVMILGEAGIGKSRLMAEVRQQRAPEVTWVEGHCFAYSRSLSYGPFLDLLRRFVDIADEDGEAGTRANLRARLSELFPDDKEIYAIFAQLLSMRLEPEEAAIVGAMSGESFRKCLFTVMEKFLTQLAAPKPLVVVFEDLQWADRSSIELVGHLFSVTARAPVAIIALFRSKQESSDNWEMLAPALEGYRDRYTEFSLQPLSDDSSRDLVDGLLSGTELPQKLCDAVIDRAEGNPFFVEEMLRSLIERGILVREGSTWNVTELLETLQVPDTLQGLLLSRIDRLPDQTKRVVQKAAVIGRVFLYRVLKHMAQEEEDLESQISLIEDAELVREQARLPEVEYVFKHALTQEVAYKTLLSTARKSLHQKVGQAMEAIFAERIEEFTGILAYHYFCGEGWEKALEYSTRAANRASQLYAYAESREHYRRAIESLKHLPDTEEYRRKRVDLTVDLVNVSLQSASPEQNLALLLAAEPIAESLGDRACWARVQLWIGRVHYLAGRLREASGYFQKVLAVASEVKDPELLSLPGAFIGRMLFMQGDFARSQKLLSDVVPLLEATRNYNELLFAYAYRGAAKTALGDYTAGAVDITTALKMARASRNQNAEALAQTGFALIKLIAGKYTEGIVNAREALVVAEKSGDAMFRYSTNAFIAWGLTGVGDYAKAITHWAASHEAAKPLGGRLLLGDWLAAIESETYLGKGDLDTALEKGEKALQMSKASGSVIAEALSERTLGRVCAARSSWEEGEEHLAKSASLLQSINARFDLARTSLAQAQVALARQKKDEAMKFLQNTLELTASCGLPREQACAESLLAKMQPA
jgi:class 3 adenylate cyclase/tetratricopeptide (TPR) repeat protein